jgi:hypothetical protein
MKLFCFLAGKRGKWVLLLWCAGFTGIALPIAAAFLLWQGISVGMLVALAGFRLGIRGIVIGCFALLPQTLLYLPAWFFFLFYVCRRECMQQIEGKRRAFAVYLAVLGLMSICTALGVLAESSINPWILKKMLHFLGY